MYLKVPIILLAMIEGALLLFVPYLGGAIAYQGRNFASLTPTGNLFATALLFASLGLASLTAVGLYTTRQRTSTAGILVRVVAAVLNAAALSALFYYVFPALRVDRSVLGITAGIAITACFA